MTFKAEPASKKANFYKIKDGTFRLPTTKEDPAAVARPFTNPKTKTDGVAYERSFKSLYGQIHNITFQEKILEDGTRLKSLNISLGEDEEGTGQIISLPEDSRYASDFLAKLPNIDLAKPVGLAPYDFEKDGPRQVGISLTQEIDDTVKKITDFFVEKVQIGMETKRSYSHGYPEATDDDKSDWKFYFTKVNKFLVKYAQQNILPKFAAGSGQSAQRGNDFTAFSGGAPKDNSDDLLASVPF